MPHSSSDKQNTSSLTPRGALGARGEKKRRESLPDHSPSGAQKFSGQGCKGASGKE
jgi:hypothetical protein